MTAQIQLINGAASESATAGGFFTGFARPSRYQISEAAIEQANERLFRAKKGIIPLSEAFSTSDFTMAAFAAIDTQLQQRYDELPSVWKQYTSLIKVNDFRPTRLLDKWSQILGLKLVPEGSEYQRPDSGVSYDQWWINVVKMGLQDGITFEAKINNEAIGEIEDLPTKLANAAAEAETINALANLLLVDEKTNLASDINTGFFKSANGNAPTNLPLTATNLDAVIDTLLSKRSKRNRLQAVPQLQVVHPAALRGAVRRIQNLREIRRPDGADTMVYDNYLKTVDFVEEPMLDVINTHAKALTTWFVLPKPDSRRPASFAAQLRGYETPDLRVKADTGMRPGGGAISPLEGSFDVDTIDYRVRHILGHQAGDALYTYASYGA